LYVVKPGVDIYAPRHYNNIKKKLTQCPYKPFSQNVSNSLDHEISIIKNNLCNVIYTSKIIDPIGEYIKKEIFGLDIIKKSFIGTNNSSKEKAVKDLENGYFFPTSTLFFHKPFYDKDLHFFGGTTFLIV
jgi:hypothetical protein